MHKDHDGPDDPGPPNAHQPSYSPISATGLLGILNWLDRTLDGRPADPKFLIRDLTRTCFRSARIGVDPENGALFVAFVLRSLGKDRSERIVDLPTWALMRLLVAFGGLFRIHDSKSGYYIRYQPGGEPRETFSLLRLVADAGSDERVEQINREAAAPGSPRSHYDHRPSNLRIVPAIANVDTDRPTRPIINGRPEAEEAALARFERNLSSTGIWLAGATPSRLPQQLPEPRGIGEYLRAIRDAASLIAAVARPKATPTAAPLGRPQSDGGGEGADKPETPAMFGEEATRRDTEN